MATDYPIVQCKRDADGNLYFYCKHCRTTHHHGTSGGHRIAHCHSPKSPYQSTGYILKVPE